MANDLRERVERLEQENQVLYKMILEDRQAISGLAREVLALQMLVPGNDKKQHAISFRKAAHERQ